MDTEWLKTFVITAERENFRRAAETLFINQTTVSHHIARLEEFLGLELFERVGRGVQLSADGRRFLAFAQRMVALEEESRRVLQESSDHMHIALAASPSLAETVLPWLCQALYRQPGTIDIAVSVYASSEMGHALAIQPPDGALTRMPMNAGHLLSRLLFRDPVDLVLPVLDSWERASYLQTARLIIQPSSGYTRVLLENLRSMDFHPRFMEVDQISATKRLVEEHVGMAFLPRSSTVRETLEGRLATMTLPESPPLWDAVYWVTPRERTPSTMVTRAEDILKRRWPESFKP